MNYFLCFINKCGIISLSCGDTFFKVLRHELLSLLFLTLNYWSLGKHLILFPENLNEFSMSSGNIEMRF